MHSADPMRALSEPGSQDAPTVAAAAVGASASLKRCECDNLDIRHCETLEANSSGAALVDKKQS